MAEVTVQDVGPCKKQLRIVVPAAEVQKKVEETYKRLQSNAVVDGFRKGHVPRKLIERRFGEEVVEEVKQDILAESAQQALDDQKLKALGQPSFDKVEFETDKDCVFEVTVEIEPEFDLPEYKGLKLKKPVPRVSDEDVQRGMDNLRRQRAKLELMPEGTPVEAGDLLVADWALRCDGEDVASEKDDQFMVRGPRFGDLELEKDLGEILAGAKSGEIRTAAVTVLDTYAIEKWRGKKGEVAFTPKEVRRPILPEVNEEFAKSMDFASLDEMKNYLRSRIEASVAREAEMVLEQRLYDALLEKCPFVLPEGVLKSQARNIMVRQQLRLRQRGIPDDEIEKRLEDLRNASEEAAARGLKTHFLVDRIAEQEKIFVTENEVENRIAMLANSYRMSAAKLRAQLENEGTLAELRGGMREDKVTRFLLDHAEIEEEK